MRRFLLASLLAFPCFCLATENVNFVTCGVDQAPQRPELVLELWGGGAFRVDEDAPTQWMGFWAPGTTLNSGICISLRGMGPDRVHMHSNAVLGAKAGKFNDACEVSGDGLQGIGKSDKTVERGQNFEFLAAVPETGATTFLIHTHFLSVDELAQNIDVFAEKYCRDLVVKR